MIIRAGYHRKCLVFILISLLGFSAAVSWAHHRSWHHPHKNLTLRTLKGLEFGKIAPNVTSTGLVTVSARNKNSSRCGVGLTCFESGSRAEFRLKGRHFRTFRVAVSGDAVLTDSAGHTMRVDDFVLFSQKVRVCNAASCFGRLNANGKAKISVGATLHVGKNQPPGKYTGTFYINATYE